MVWEDDDLVEDMGLFSACEGAKGEPGGKLDGGPGPEIEIGPVMVIGFAQAGHQDVDAFFERGVRDAGVGFLQRFVVEFQFDAVELPRQEWSLCGSWRSIACSQGLSMVAGQQHAGDEVVGGFVGGGHEARADSARIDNWRAGRLRWSAC